MFFLPSWKYPGTWVKEGPEEINFVSVCLDGDIWESLEADILQTCLTF